MNHEALNALYAQYPETARLLQGKGMALLERCPDELRVRLRDFIAEFVAVFSDEHETVMVKRVQTTVYDAYGRKPGK